MVSSVPVVPFIATCVVVGSERTRGPAPLQAREMLWKCPWRFHELVGATLSAFCGHVLSRVGDRTAWPNSRETEQEEEEAGQLTPLQKDKSFVVLKIRSHSADPTFHSSGTELFQDAEWEGQRCGSARRAVVAKSVLRVRGERDRTISKVGSRGRAGGCPPREGCGGDFSMGVASFLSG